MQITLSGETEKTLILMQKSSPQETLEELVENAIYEYDLRKKIQAGLDDEAAGRYSVFDPEEFKKQLAERMANGKN